MAFIRRFWRILEPNREFIGGWAIEGLCEHLEAITRGEITGEHELTRLLANVSPGTMKSLLVNCFWPAWEWGPMGLPHLRYIAFSYAAHLTERDNARFRDIVRSPDYKELWGHVFKLTEDGKIKVANDKMGFKFASSIGGVGTGERGDRVLCFPAGEMVLTEEGPTAIEEIVGARMNLRVWSRNLVTGWTELKPIIGWHTNPGRRLVRVRTASGGDVACTIDHKIYTARGLVPADEIMVGDCVLVASAFIGHGVSQDQVVSVDDVPEVPSQTYCITVAGNGNLFCGQGSYILSKNCDDPHSVGQAESDKIRESTVRWFRETMSNRLNDLKKSAIVVIMQRVHQDDVSGAILQDGGYDHFCYDDATEVLTKDGWVSFRDLQKGVPVLAVNPSTLDAAWETPTAYVDLPYDGHLYHYKSTAIDLMVTPDHRMVFKDYNDWRTDKRTNWRVKAAKDLPRHFYVPQAVKWSGTIRNGDQIDFAGVKWDAGAFAEFMGWYLSEGCTSVKACNTRIVQKEGVTADIIRGMLSRIPFKHIEKPHSGGPDQVCFSIYGKRLAEALEPFGGSHDRYAPDLIKDMEPDLLQKFVVAYGQGDGCAAGRNGTGMLISSRSKRMIGCLHECCLKIGWAASGSSRMNGPSLFQGRTPMPGGWQHFLYIRYSKAESHDFKWYAKVRAANVALVPYVGRVYCVSVPSTALVVRRNGRVSVSGNCVPMEYDSTRHCTTSIGWSDPRSEDGELAWPERFSAEDLATFKRRPYLWAGQYQQSPAPRGGGIIKEHWWQVYEVVRKETGGYRFVPDFGVPDFVVASVDAAFGTKQENDFTACCVIACITHPETKHRRLLLVDAWQKRLPLHGDMLEKEPGESDVAFRRRQQAAWGAVEWIAHTCRVRKVDRLLIENKARGHDIIAELRRLYADEHWGIRPVNPTADKVARAHSVVDLFADGMIYAPAEITEHGDVRWLNWADETIRESSVFPNGSHDDLPDALIQALKHLREVGVAVLREEKAAVEREIASKTGGPRQSIYGV